MIVIDTRTIVILQILNRMAKSISLSFQFTDGLGHHTVAVR